MRLFMNVVICAATLIALFDIGLAPVVIADVPDDFVMTPETVKLNDDFLGNVADQFAQSVPIWFAGDGIPVDDYQTMVHADGTIMAAMCWDEYSMTEADGSGQLIACVLWGLEGSTGVTSITGSVELTTNDYEAWLPSDPATVMVMALYGYTLDTNPFGATIPMIEGATALLAWPVPTGFSGDVAIDIPGGDFWVPYMFRNSI